MEANALNSSGPEHVDSSDPSEHEEDARASDSNEVDEADEDKLFHQVIRDNTSLHSIQVPCQVCNPKHLYRLSLLYRECSLNEMTSKQLRCLHCLRCARVQIR